MNNPNSASGTAEHVNDNSAPVTEQPNQSSYTKTGESHELSVARHMARHGLRCIPLVKGRKIPRKGFAWKKMATTDPSVIEAEFASGEHDVGVVPGSGGFVVLDVDVKNGKRGDLSIELLEEEHGPLSNTLTQTTKSGGRHLWFRRPDDIRIGNSGALLKKRLGVGHGIDVREDNGYAVVQAEGYAFDTLDERLDQSLILPLPSSLLSLLALVENSCTEALENQCPPINYPSSTVNRGTSPQEVEFEDTMTESDWLERVDECLMDFTYLPVREGERNAKLISFVAEMKRLASCPTKFPEEIIRRWHAIAMERGSQSPVSDSLKEARHVWENYDPKKSKAERAAVAAKGQRINGYEAPGKQHELYFIYRELMDPEGISYVPQRHLCKYLNVHKKTVARYQKCLADDGYLILAEEYEPHKKCKRFGVIPESDVNPNPPA